MLCIVQDVEEDLQLSMSEGLKLHNRSKNRYSKVLPCQSPQTLWCIADILPLSHSLCGIISDHIIRRGISRYESQIARTLCLENCTHIKDVLNTATSMEMPFYCGLAAYVYLKSVESRNVVIPGGEDIEGQARFWKDHYHS